MAISGGDGSIILSTKIDTKGIKAGLTELKGMVKTAQKAFAAMSIAAGAAAVAVTKMAVSAYADYEQLVGGVETLFKGSADKVKKYAEDAFYTAGVSANEYMKQVTSFSASLISSTAGDTEKAADVANMALIDMSDNANKMGSTLESITMAYQGFAKQQYMLLDNLKLGYGGTRTEMERLLKDAEAYLATQGESVKLSIDNLADVYTAINAIQRKLGIAGTTAREAEETIAGSAAMTKASWENLLVAMSGGGDLDKAINNFAYSVEKYFQNIVPVVEKALMGIGRVVEKVGPLLIQTISRAIIKALPSIINAIYGLIRGIYKGVFEGFTDMLTGKTQEQQLEKQLVSTEQVAGNIEQQVENQEALNEEMEKTLAGFDEIQILSASGAKEGEQEEELQVPTISTGGAGALGDTKEIEDTVQQLLDNINKKIGVSLMAIGLILLAFGNIPVGLALIVIGAKMYATEESEGEDVEQKIKDTLDAVKKAIIDVAIYSLIIGLFLICVGYITPISIGMVVAGAAALAISFKANPQETFNMIRDTMRTLAPLLIALGVVALVIGIILVCTGVGIGIGIGLIIAGVTAVFSGVMSLIPNDLQDEIISVMGKVFTFLTENPYLMMVLGCVLMLTIVGFTYGLALVAAGAYLLATGEEPMQDSVKESIKTALDIAYNFIKSNNWALLVLGIVLVALGGPIGAPFGFALIAAHAGTLSEAQEPALDYLPDRVKQVWELIKAYWNKHIAPIFTAQWWLDLATACGTALERGFAISVNAIIGMFESMVNNAISGINRIIRGINNLAAKAGEIIGFTVQLKEIGSVSFGRVDVPSLATGKVTPAKSAMDSVSGLNQSSYANWKFGTSQSASGNTEVVLQIDGREFGRAVIEQGALESNRVGTRLVMG